MKSRFTSMKISEDLKVTETKSSLVNQYCVVYESPQVICHPKEMPRKVQVLYLWNAFNKEKETNSKHSKDSIPAKLFSTICVQPWNMNVLCRMFIFQTRQLPRQLSWLDKWKCFVLSTKLWMFFKEMWHVLLTWSAALTNLKTRFRVLKAWCHCDFRKMETLKVHKFGRTYRTGTQAVKALVVRSYFSSIFMQRSARETWHTGSYSCHLLLHNDRNVTLAFQHMEVLALRSVIFLTKI